MSNRPSSVERLVRLVLPLAVAGAALAPERAAASAPGAGDALACEHAAWAPLEAGVRALRERWRAERTPEAYGAYAAARAAALRWAGRCAAELGFDARALGVGLAPNAEPTRLRPTRGLPLRQAARDEPAATDARVAGDRAASGETRALPEGGSVADLQAFSVFGAEVQTNGLPGSIVNTNSPPPLPDLACCNFGGTTVTAGRRIQWDTTIVNAGPDPAAEPRIEVLLPLGASVIENTLTGLPNVGQAPGRCTIELAGGSYSLVVCLYPNLNLGELGSLRFQVLIDPGLPLGTQLSLGSSASTATFDPNLSNNITGIQFDDNVWSDLQLDKSAEGPLPWRAGETRTWSYVLNHRGPSLARDVRLVDLLPAEVEFVEAWYAADDPPGVVLDPCIPVSAQELDCRLGDVRPTPGAAPKPTLYVSARIRPETPDGTPITNVALVDSDSPDPVPGDNDDSAGVIVAAALHHDLAIFKDAPLWADPGETIVYTIYVDNQGISPMPNVVVRDYLHADLEPLSVTPSQGNCIVGVPGDPGYPLTCNLGSLAPGASAQIDLEVRVDPASALVVLFNDVTVAGGIPDEDGSDDLYSARTGLPRTIFADDFESGDTLAWNLTQP